MNDDPLWEALEALPQLTPDPRRQARIRAACHVRLQRRAKRNQLATHLFHGAATAALCAYLASVLSAALPVVMRALQW